MTRATLDPSAPFFRHPLRPHELLERVTPAEDTIVLCQRAVVCSARTYEPRLWLEPAIGKQIGKPRPTRCCRCGVSGISGCIGLPQH